MKKIKEYLCRKCNKTFMVLIEVGKKVFCPSCGSDDLVYVPNSPKKTIQINCKCAKEK